MTITDRYAPGLQSYNKMSYTKKILWLIPVTVNITDKNYNAPSGALTYDSYPGGYFNTGFEPSNASSTNYWTKYNISVSHQRKFNFIPATSVPWISAVET